jgi:O-acetylhomoserine/O-acetylserine sulfhydrylase-like pyridoxal-dependent enzyme
VIGGALVGSGRFDWIAAAKNETLTEPYAGYQGLVFAEHFGPSRSSCELGRKVKNWAIMST